MKIDKSLVRSFPLFERMEDADILLTQLPVGCQKLLVKDAEGLLALAESTKG